MSMNDSVKSAARVLDLLELFSVASDPMGVSEVSRLLAIPKSSGQALLSTLVSRGYLVKQGSSYEMGPDLRRGNWVGGSLSRLVKTANPAMRRLADESGESAFLSLMTASGELKYVAKAVSSHVVRYDAPLSNSRPAYCTSSGLILLAYLDSSELEEFFSKVSLERITPNTVTDRKELMLMLEKARRQGFAELCDGHVMGASGVSALVFNGSEKPAAALTLVAPTARFLKSRVFLRQKVIAFAAELSRSVQPSQPRAAKTEKVAS